VNVGGLSSMSPIGSSSVGGPAGGVQGGPMMKDMSGEYGPCAHPVPLTFQRSWTPCGSASSGVKLVPVMSTSRSTTSSYGSSRRTYSV
jgi:hypothetical protein